jgi:hypothetical protein
MPKNIHGIPVVVIRRHRCWLEKNIELGPKEKKHGFDIA